jgi:hypothetical protein
MDAERIPAEAFPLAELLGDEMIARGWTTDDVAIQMGGDETEIAHNMFVVMLMLSVQREGLLVGEETFNSLARAFGVDSNFFRNIDAAWRNAPADRRQFYSPPEQLFGPISRRGFIRAV